VKISFKDKKFGKLVNGAESGLVREYGKVRAEKIRARLAQLSFSLTLEDVRYLPGNYHELKLNRKGQWACDLDQPYRLIFTPHESPIPANESGQYIWIEITGVEIIEVINYHKEK
jgi:proteic killer suppression protein